jgi:hypothetical protein
MIVAVMMVMLGMVAVGTMLMVGVTVTMIGMIVRVIMVTIAMVMTGVLMAVVRVALLMLMAVRVGFRGLHIGAALWIERRFERDDAGAEPLDHLFDGRVAADAQSLGRQLDVEVTGAETPGDAHEAERVGRADFDERLRRGDDFDDASVLEPEAVATAQHRGFLEVEQEGEAADAGHDEAPAIALLVSKHDAVGRLARPGARRNDPVRTQHVRLSPVRLAPASMDEAKEERQPACKPGSVWPGFWPRRDGHSSGTPVAGRLEQPTRATRPTDEAPQRPKTPRIAPIRSCSRRGLPCRRRCRPRGALLPHPFTLTLGVGPCGPRAKGGLLSVALSLGSPPPDVIRRRIRMEPGLSSAFAAAVRPTGATGIGALGRGGQGESVGAPARPPGAVCTLDSLGAVAAHNTAA